MCCIAAYSFCAAQLVISFGGGATVSILQSQQDSVGVQERRHVGATTTWSVVARDAWVLCLYAAHGLCQRPQKNGMTSAGVPYVERQGISECRCVHSRAVEVCTEPAFVVDRFFVTGAKVKGRALVAAPRLCYRGADSCSEWTLGLMGSRMREK